MLLPSLPTTSAGRPHTTKSESSGLLSKQRATDLLATPFPEKIGSTISADTRQNRILARAVQWAVCRISKHFYSVKFETKPGKFGNPMVRIDRKRQKALPLES